MNPLIREKFRRFKSIKRGYYSFIILFVVTLFSFVAEFFINDTALVVSFRGKWSFPIVNEILAKAGWGEINIQEDYGLKGKSKPNYAQLKKNFQKENKASWVLMPIIPYGANTQEVINHKPINEKIAKLKEKRQNLKGKENIINRIEIGKEIAKLERAKFHPQPPSWGKQHYLGTDQIGRDILARLVYGYRIAFLFSFVLLVFTYVVGIFVGCLMGYFGKTFDIVVQRLIEVFNMIPGLYVMIIIASLWGQGFWKLVAINLLLGWMGMTWYMRTATYKEKTRDYILAAKSMGASNTRVILSHILPNQVSLITTFIPFSISGGILSLSALDFLGYGLPIPTPSWGELISQGTENLQSRWIILSVFFALVFILCLVNLCGEALREAFDPKKETYYE